jgi:Double zinc ribbon
MSSAISTKRRAPASVDESISGTPRAANGTASGLALWQLYALLGMMAAAAAVWVSGHTHPLALVLISAVALASALVALTLHRALAALLGRGGEVAPLGERQRDLLEGEKARVLRSIKELEFDRAMGKIGDADFAEIAGRLRARALTLMQDLERDAPADSSAVPTAQAPVRRRCPACKTTNDPDAKFCKQCGKALG